MPVFNLRVLSIEMTVRILLLLWLFTVISKGNSNMTISLRENVVTNNECRIIR